MKYKPPLRHISRNRQSSLAVVGYQVLTCILPPLHDTRPASEWRSGKQPTDTAGFGVGIFMRRFKEKGMRHSRNQSTLVSKSHIYACPQTKATRFPDQHPPHFTKRRTKPAAKEAARFLPPLWSRWENEQRLALLPAKAAGSGEHEC